jgi:hypothetical protein
LYKKLPPLDKLLAKIGCTTAHPSVQGVKKFIEVAHLHGQADATLPDLRWFGPWLLESFRVVPVVDQFAVYDLVRIAMADPRVSGYYAEEKNHTTIAPLFRHVNSLENCPYGLRLVALQLACNLFSSHLYVPHIMKCEVIKQPLLELITTSLLDEDHPHVRVAVASLVLNIAAANNKIRLEAGREDLPETDQTELAAALLQALSTEEKSAESLRGLLLALGQLTFCAPLDSELLDLLKAMDAQGTVLAKKEFFPDEPLIGEVGKVLLGCV